MQVQGVPYLFLSCHPTWNSRVTSWELVLKIPKPVVQGWKMTMVNWKEAQRKSSSNFLLRVVSCDALLFVEGLEDMHMQDGADLVEWKRSKHRCNLTELSGFLLCQVCLLSLSCESLDIVFVLWWRQGCWEKVGKDWREGTGKGGSKASGRGRGGVFFEVVARREGYMIYLYLAKIQWAIIESLI